METHTNQATDNLKPSYPMTNFVQILKSNTGYSGSLVEHNVCITITIKAEIPLALFASSLCNK